MSSTQTAVSGITSIPGPTAWKAGTLHAGFGPAAEGNVPSRRRIEMAQEHLSHRQKRLFLITEQGTPETLNAASPAWFSILCRTGVAIRYPST
jgi:hypothetical protein